VRRQRLSHGAWIDLRPGWLRGADLLFERLLDGVPWRAERRQMYDRVVDVPRLLAYYGEEDGLPDPALVAARAALNRHYGAELGEPFRTAGLCLYRDGRDSVAWHGDTIGRGATEDTMVAIVSVGAPRGTGAAAARARRHGRSGHAPLRARPRRSDRHGWQLPADLGARGAEDRPPGRSADQHSVPAYRRALSAASAAANASRRSATMSRRSSSISAVTPLCRR
jgi:alkylated DNA repair dioxygenase AlkB